MIAVSLEISDEPKFFPNWENSSAQSAVEPLRATAGMPGDAPMARLYDPMRAREHYIILGVGKTGENGVISWCNWVVEHPVEHNVPRSFCNVPRTFVEQSKIVNVLIYIVEHPWNTAQ